jgi:hypothetical protein
MIIFLSVFLAVYFALNSYVVLKLASLLKYQNNAVILGLIIFFTAGFPLATLIERFIPNLISRIFYTIASTWVGVMFLLFSTLVVYEIIRFFIKIDPKIACMTILIFVLIISLISIINAFFVVVKDVEVPITNLKEELSIVQLSDIHIGTIRNSAFMNKVVEKTNKLDPDVVVITGDVVDAASRLEPEMFSPFDKLRARVFFVTGNHETYEGIDNVYKLLDNSKIKILDNEVSSFDGIQIIGIEYSENKTHLKEKLSELNFDKNKPAILLYHSPSGMEYAKEYGIDLQLSGHTHAGQIFPFTLLSRIFFPKVRGLYDLDGMYLYVSPGTGTWGPYMRLGSRNEITLLKLVKK